MKYLYSLLAIIVTLNVSAFCETGNPTASGVMPQVGHCAVDKINGQWVPFGTKIRIIDQSVGIHELVVTDRFGGSYNNRMDIFMDGYKKCIEFGRQDLEAEVEVAE